MNTILCLFYPFVHLVFFAGLLFRKSGHPDYFGQYSLKQLGLLSLLLLTFPLWPWLFRRWERSGRPSSFSLLLILLLFFMAIESLNFRKELGERDGYFHPFLQMVAWQKEKALPPAPYGFRTGPVPLKKAPHEIRVALLGGSTVLNLYLNDEDTVALKLQKRLNAWDKKNHYRVINAGNVWFTTEHTLINYLQRIRPLDVDLVIAFHAINDMARSFSPPRAAVEDFRVDYSHFWGPQIDWVQRANAGAWQRTQLYFLLTKVLFNRFRLVKAARRKAGVFPWPSLKIFEKNMATLVTLLRSDARPLILATQGTKMRLDLSPQEKEALPIFQHLLRNREEGPDFPEVLRAFSLFNDRVRKLCREESIPCVDLEKELPATGDYFFDEVHMTARAADRAAALFFKECRKIFKSRR
jgi:hypothetical protein